MRSAGHVSADLPRHVTSWTPAAYVQPRGSHEQEVEMEKKKAEYERRMIVLNQRVADASQSTRRISRLGVVGQAFLLLRRAPLGRGERGKRGGRRRRPSPLPSDPPPVCGHGDVGKGPAFARRRLVVVDVFVNMYDKFQQSPFYTGRCLLPFLRQSGGHSCYACRDVYPQCKLCRRPSFLQVLFLDSASAWHWWCHLRSVTHP